MLCIQPNHSTHIKLLVQMSVILPDAPQKRTGRLVSTNQRLSFSRYPFRWGTDLTYCRLSSWSSHLERLPSDDPNHIHLFYYLAPFVRFLAASLHTAFLVASCIHPEESLRQVHNNCPLSS